MNNVANKNLVWAAITAFYPNKFSFMKLIISITPQVDKILILNNGGISYDILANLSIIPNLEIHTFESNKGVAFALNYAFSLAAVSNIKFIITFDQDSVPSSDFVKTLVDCHNLIIKVDKYPIGAIGPRIVDDRNKNFNYPFYKLKFHGFFREIINTHEPLFNVDLLITSGMLIPVSVWNYGIIFNNDLFIDFVDTDWCFSAIYNGFSLHCSYNSILFHNLSDSPPLKFLGLSFFSYNHTRRYYYFRNIILFIVLPYVPVGYRFRVLVSGIIRFIFLPISDKSPFKSICSSIRGLFDGFWKIFFGSK